MKGLILIAILVYSAHSLQNSRTARSISANSNAQLIELSPSHKCEDGAYSPHSNESASIFYMCSHGQKIKLACSPGLTWNPAIKACDWPPAEKMAISPSQKCTRAGEFKAHESDCTLYYWCVFGEYQVSHCSPGTFWNMNRCDWTCGSDTPHSPSLTPVTPPSITHAMEWEWEPWAPAVAHENNTARPLILPTSSYKMVCYFTNWAYYRPGSGKFKPSDVDFNLCTHIAYAFSTLNYDTLCIQPHDSWLDLESQFYKQLVALKKHGLKILLALGGWNDSQGDKYSRLVQNEGSRARFVDHAVQFLEKHGFDGLDLDWEYPTCWQNNCKKGPLSDREAFSKLVQEISEAFKPRGLLLSAAVSAGKEVIDIAYDVPILSKYMDWISVMTYDYHGQWEYQTGHVAPLYYMEGDLNPYLNVNYSIHYWLSKGADPSKLIMGMPLYGQSFTLKEWDQLTGETMGFNLPISGGGQAGEFTRQSGMLAYYEICQNILKKSWRIQEDPQALTGPIAHDGLNQLVTFDDVKMLEIKSNYIKSMGLGGGMIWAIDLDDFKGDCGCGPSPLLKTINRVLRSYPESVSPTCLDSTI